VLHCRKQEDIQELLVSELGSVAEEKNTIQNLASTGGEGITKGMRL